MPRWRPLSASLVLSLSLCTPALSACAGTQGASAPAPAGAHGPAIEWADWGPTSFERAAAEDKLILINVVATWCHWCHVMDDTTYADPEVAAFLREHFVVIRVDSDARPDLSERYRAWGWPATAILSAQATPALNLRGYREPEVFLSLLRELVDEQARGELRQAVRSPRELNPGEGSSGDLDIAAIRELTVAQLDPYFDPDDLGWGQRQKYPWSGPLDAALLRARIHPGDAQEQAWRARALATLKAERALIDPVWGGMYQYSLHGVWDRPHYEKIAMIQAGAIENYAHAAMLEPDEPRWRTDADDITRYLLERMQDPTGGFYTSQDADLRRADLPTVDGLDFYALGDAARRALGEPRIDAAVYADLNGLTIHALTELYRVEGNPVLLEAAVRAGERMLATHRRPSGGFTHGAQTGTTRESSSEPEPLLHLADQAALGQAFIGLHRVSADPRWLDAARELAQFMRRELADPEGGGFYAHTLDPAAVGVFAQRRKPLAENALAATFLIALHQIEDGDGSVDSPWLALAREALVAVGRPEQIARQGKVLGRYLVALDLLAANKIDVTVVGDPDDPETLALWRAALSLYEPRANIERGLPGERYPDLGEAAVFACTDTACSMPMSDPAQVRQRGPEFFADNL